MKRRVLCWVCIFLLSGCATPKPPPPIPEATLCKYYPFNPVAENITPDILEQYPLNYTKVVEDPDGNPLMKLTFEYTGRCPDPALYGPDNPYTGKDFNITRYSFYKVTYENLTDAPIRLKTTTSRLLFEEEWIQYNLDREGNRVLKKVPAATHQNDIENPHRFDGVFLSPKEIKSHGSWCYSRKGEVWIYTLTFEIEGENYTLTYHRVGH